MATESIVDASLPSAGRIYDYLLGGHHNFEVDRQTAQQLVQLLPFLPKASRLQRWALQDIARILTEERGFDIIVDFASGLPTEDHIHQVVPPGTTVIYSDRDPVVVEYAREILQGTSNIYFFEADAARPEELLNRPEVQRILQGRRDVAIVYWGISLFLQDHEIRHAARYLYDWTAARSCWVFNAQGAGGGAHDPGTVAAAQIYADSGSPVHIRTLAEYEQMIQPWKANSPGFLSLLQWHGFDESAMSDGDRDAFGPTGAGYGAFLQK